jgi:aspartate aminotransferase-like enzyme
VVVIVSGKFGQRWADMAAIYGLKVHVVDVEWGKAADVAKVKQVLDNHPNTKGLFTQACETSTTTWNPVQELAALVEKNNNCLFLVDGITAVGCTQLPFDKWSIDVLVAGSQKAFSLPTGLSFVCLSEKAWKANESAKCPRYYFDLLKERQANEKGQTFFSSAVSHIRGLEAFLLQVNKIGLEALIRRTQNLARCTQKAAEGMGLTLFSHSPSPSVTALCVPDSIDGAKLRSHMELKYQVTVMGGQDHLKGKIIRIGHMGDISNDDQLATLEALGKSLKELGYAVSDDTLNETLLSAEEFLKMCSNV